MQDHQNRCLSFCSTGHLLVFHAHLVRTKRGKFLFHYQPLAILVTYTTIYYIFAIFAYSCENDFDYESAWCGFVCYSNFAPNGLQLFEYLAHEIFPLFLEALISILLILRVVLQKRRMRQQADWRKNRKMVLQLVSVSFVTIAFNMPDVINPLFQLTSGYLPIPDDVQGQILDYLGFGSSIFLPFACLATIPKLKEKCQNALDYRRWLVFVNHRRHLVVGTVTNVVTTRH
jgi:hypothetical protein